MFLCLLSCFFLLSSYQLENDFYSNLQAPDLRRAEYLMAKPTKATSLYLPPTHYNSQSDVGFYGAQSDKLPANPQVLRSLSPEDVQRMKYKIDLG